MTISAADIRVATGTGNGAIGQTFDGTFKIFATSDLLVYVETSTDDEFELKTEGVDYSVTFDEEASTWTVTTLVAFTSSRDVRIFGNVPQTQPTALPREKATPSKTLEKMYDRLAIQVLEQQEQLNRALLQPKLPSKPSAVELPALADRKSKFLAFDAAGDPIASDGGISGSILTTSFTETLLDDADAPSFLETLRAALTDLAAAPATDDEFFVYDKSVTTIKKLTAEELLRGITNLTEDASPDEAADFLLAYDDSAGAAKKVKPDSIAPNIDNVDATQAEMEAASVNTKAVTPGNANWHPGVAKGWVQFDGTGTLAVNASHNVSSVTDNGTGDYTVNWDTDFSSANYGFAGVSEHVSPGSSADVTLCHHNTTARTTGALPVETTSHAGNSDVDNVGIVAFGDQ